MLDVTVHYADGKDRSKRLEAEDAVGIMRELCFRLAMSPEIVSVTVTKSDLITRLMDGRLK